MEATTLPLTLNTHPLSILAPLVVKIESILYAAKEPAAISAIAATLEVQPQEVEAALHELNVVFEGRGVRLQRNGNRVQLITAPENAEAVQKFLGLEETTRLSSAAMETLAIIAYNQPVTKPQIEMIRGVNCDGVMATLEARNLVVELGRAETVGHPMRFGVSFDFLRHFGLKGVHELPPVESLEVLPKAEMEKEMENEELGMEKLSEGNASTTA
jgi:segregation and condensation protein B